MPHSHIFLESAALAILARSISSYDVEALSNVRVNRIYKREISLTGRPFAIERDDLPLRH